MATPTLEERVAALETEVEQLKQRQIPDKSCDVVPWWKKIVGVHKDDPDYNGAMRWGREWRELQRPPDYEDVP